MTMRWVEAATLPWGDGFLWPSIVAFVGWAATFGLGFLLACRAREERVHSDVLPPGKQRPIFTDRWQLPAAPLSGLDWSGGVASKLVFIGAATAAALAATDLLGAVLSPDQRIVFAALNIAAAFVVGLGPLSVALIPSRFAPAIELPPNTKPVVIGEEESVATVWGINAGAAFTAAGVLMQLGALAWLAENANILQWMALPLALVALATVAYSCVTVWTLTATGCLPPMVDKPSSTEHPTQPPVPGLRADETPAALPHERAARPGEQGAGTPTGGETTSDPVDTAARTLPIPVAVRPAPRRLLP